MDVREAAKAMAVHTQTVYNMLNDGRLPAKKVEDGSWDIPIESINKILSDKAEELKKIATQTDIISSHEKNKQDILKNIEGRLHTLLTLYNENTSEALLDEMQELFERRKALKLYDRMLLDQLHLHMK